MGKEENIRSTTGFILWGISAFMSMGLYLGYAGVSWYSLLIAGILSAALESGKILSFRRGGVRFKILGICLAGMTLLTILGSTLVAIDAKRQSSLQTRLSALQISREYQDTLRQETAIRAQGDDLQRRISKMPDDWVSLTLKLTDELGGLHQEQRRLSGMLTTMEHEAATETSSQDPSIFNALGKVFGQDGDRVEVLLLLILAGLVELTAFALAGHSDQVSNNSVVLESRRNEGKKPDSGKKSGSTQTQSFTRPAGVTPEAYLKVALDHPKRPYLLGRGKVCEVLGISESVAKDFIEELVKESRVKRDGKYFRAV